MMKTLLLLAFMAVAAAPAFADADAKENAAVGKLVDSFASAWNKHDTKGMAALFNADADLINPMGREAKGQSEIAQLLGDEQAGAMKTSNIAFKVTSVHKLSWNHFFMDADGDVAGMMLPDGKSGEMKVHMSALVEKNAGKYSFINARAYTFMTLPPAASMAAAPAAPSAPAPAPAVAAAPAMPAAAAPAAPAVAAPAAPAVAAPQAPAKQ